MVVPLTLKVSLERNQKLGDVDSSTQISRNVIFLGVIREDVLPFR